MAGWIQRNADKFFDITSHFYAWMVWNDTWIEHICDVSSFFCDLPQPVRVLDVGIGPGVSGIGVLDRLPTSDIVGLDLSTRMLSIAKRRLDERGVQLELVHADAAKMPFEDASFDAVLGHSFLYLVPERDAVMSEIDRVLRPGGRCVFVEPSEEGTHAAWMRMGGQARFRLSMALWRIVSGHVGRMSRSELEGIFSCFLQDVHVEKTLGGLGWVAMGVRPEGSPRH